MVNVCNQSDSLSGPHIGRVIHHYRQRLNLSQQEVAGLLSVPCSMYKQYEAGIHPIPRDHLSILLEQLKIAPDEVVTVPEGLSFLLEEEISEETLQMVDQFHLLDQRERDEMLQKVKELLEEELNQFHRVSIP